MGGYSSALPDVFFLFVSFKVLKYVLVCDYLFVCVIIDGAQEPDVFWVSPYFALLVFDSSYDACSEALSIFLGVG